MKRRNPRRASRNASPQYRSKQTTTLNASTQTHHAVFMDDLSKKEVMNDEMRDVMTDHGGCHHCRICNHTFGTSVNQHWIPQWLSHRQSKRHTTNRIALLKKMKNGKVTIPRQSLSVSPELSVMTSSSSYSEEEEEEEENEKTKKQTKRLKLTLSKSSKQNKNRYKVNCPYCSTCSVVQIPSSQTFQLKNSHCVSKQCSKEYWIQIKDNEPIITQKYPFTTNLTNLNQKRKRQTDVVPPPRKKQKPNHATYYEEDTGCLYRVVCDKNCEYNYHSNSISNDQSTRHRPYNHKMSHLEIMDKCSRSMCSDFIGGESHCWEAQPMTLPGNIKMAQIGYSFMCVWCSKAICFVDNSDNSDLDVVCGVLVSDNCQSIELQSRQIASTLICSQAVDGPSYSRVPSSLNHLRIKDRIMASDGTNWLEGWIERIDKNKVLIHFKGWNNRWDRWYNVKSGMLKTLNEYRKDRKLHSNSRNEEIYHIMRQRYPAFVATTLFESTMNNSHDHGNGGDDVLNADVVMMHDKNEVFMAVHELPIHNKTDLILSPPLFCETTTQSTQNTEKNIIELVCKCFAHLSDIALTTNHIMLIYKHCDSKIDILFFTLYCLKQTDRLCAYIKLLKKEQ